MVLPPGQARLIPAGSDIVIQFHYTTAGKAASDRSRFGLVVAKEPPRRRFHSTAVATDSFAIPPGAPNHLVQASMTLDADSELTGFCPHMHLRGKSMEYRAIYPDGGSELLLRVPRYDFNWQLVSITLRTIRTIRIRRRRSGGATRAGRKCWPASCNSRSIPRSKFWNCWAADHGRHDNRPPTALHRSRTARIAGCGGSRNSRLRRSGWESA
jgi:hypothetical protein